MNRYVSSDELYHHGVLGMKWGIRRYQNKDGSYTSLGRKRLKQYDQSDVGKRLDKAKIASRRARSERNVRDNKAYDIYDKKIINIEKGYKRGQLLSNKDSYREIQADNKYRNELKKSKQIYKNTKQEYKNAKKEYDKALKDNYKQLKKTDKIIDKLIYNSGTRQLAARYMTENKMPMDEAKKIAKKSARKNTAIAIAALGTYAYARKKLKT